MSEDGKAPPHRRITEVFFESLLIVFAVLVALGVEEYWETQEQRELAEVATEHIRDEIEANLERLDEGRPENRGLAQRIEAAWIRAGEGEESAFGNLNYELALLGTDAWETARLTLAVHYMEFDLVSELSELYEIQAFYQERQNPIVDGVSGWISADSRTDFRTRVAPIRSPLLIALQLECSLAVAYRNVLRIIDGGEPMSEDEMTAAAEEACAFELVP